VSGARRYPVPAASVRVEDRIEHSRFIATVEHAASVEDAREMIDRVRGEFPDATHHCFAYVIGPPGSTAMVASSDDGEPAGTAGRPMLKVLLNCGLGDVVAVVTRYFGGVKLGKGGLVRAYSGGVQHALHDMPSRERVDEVDARAMVPYPVIDGVRRALSRHGVTVTGELFGEQVVLAMRVPGDRIDALQRDLADLSAGAVQLERLP
jgi:uncharacterized YigZ family protein